MAMKQWAVGYFDLYENRLIVQIIEAETWHEAVRSHTSVGSRWEFDASSLEQAKMDFFNSDASIDVVEITR